jgi:hypothetical protein
MTPKFRRYNFDATIMMLKRMLKPGGCPFPARTSPGLSNQVDQIRVARWPFFGPFLANVALFESHFLEKKLFGYKLNFGYFVAIFENCFL